MVSTAVLLALAAMLAWGVWALLADVATRFVPATLAMMVSYATSVAVAGAYVVASDVQLTLPARGVAIASLAGVFAGIGAVAFYAGLDAGRTGVVTTISALYFVVAALLGVAVLGESLALRHVAGVAFAVAAVALLAS